MPDLTMEYFGHKGHKGVPSWDRMLAASWKNLVLFSCFHSQQGLLLEEIYKQTPASKTGTSFLVGVPAHKTLQVETPVKLACFT